jgi:hypothetical protein
VLFDDEVAGPSFDYRLNLQVFVAWCDKEVTRGLAYTSEGGGSHLDRGCAAGAFALADEGQRLFEVGIARAILEFCNVSIDLAEQLLVPYRSLFTR